MEEPDIIVPPVLTPLGENFRSGLEKLHTYGMARDRETDREIREVTITDDEAVAIMSALKALVEEDD